MEVIPITVSDSQLLSQVLEACVVGAVIVDVCEQDNPIVYVNSAFERLSGYSSAELLGLNCRFLQGEDHDQAGLPDIREAIKAGKVVTVTLRNYHKSGTLFYNELTLSPLRDVSGSITHFVGFQNNVTACGQALKNEAQADQTLSSALDRMTDGFMAFDHEWKLTHINLAAARISGLSREHLLGQNLLTTFPEFRDTELGRTVRRAATTGAVQRAVSFLPLYGKWIEATAYPAGDGVSLFTRDVTESHLVQETLQLSEERFSKVFQANPVAGAIIRVSDKHFIDVNEEFLRQSGYSWHELIGRTSRDLGFWINNEDREAARQMMTGPPDPQGREIQFRTKSATVRTGVLLMVAVDIAGEACVLTSVRDITVEQQAQQALKHSEQRFRDIAAALQRTLDLSLDLLTPAEVKDNNLGE